MLALTSTYSRAPPSCPEVMPLAIPGNSSLAPLLHNFQATHVGTKSLTHCPTSLDPALLPSRPQGHFINDSVFMGYYGNGTMPFPLFHNQNALMNGGSIKTLPNENMKPSMTGNQHRSRQFSNSSLEHTLPPFAMLSHLVSKNEYNNFTGLQAKSGFEQYVQQAYCPKTFIPEETNGRDQIRKRSSKSVSPLTTKTTSSECLKNLKRHHISSGENGEIVSSNKDSVASNAKQLRHSIASILNIQTSTEDENGQKHELSNGIENGSHNEDRYDSSHTDFKNMTDNDRCDDPEDGDFRDDVDIMSCSEDEKHYEDSKDSHSSPVSNNDADNKIDHTNPNKVEDVNDTSPFPMELDADEHILPDLNKKIPTDHSSLLIRNEHLEKLENFIANEDNNRFRKDDFFMSQLQIFSQGSHDDNTKCQQSNDAEMEEASETDGRIEMKRLNNLNKQSSTPMTCSAISHHSTSAYPTSSLPPIQTLCQTYHQNAVCDERSAFKPIIKSWPSAAAFSSELPAYLGQSKYNLISNKMDPSFLQNYAQSKEKMQHLSPQANSCQDLQIKSGNAKTKVDAISMLRHRSSVYQQHNVGDMAVCPRVSRSEPVPNTLGAWLSWLRGQQTPAVNSGTDQTTSSSARIPPPPRYHCDACNKTYSTFGGLSKHRQFHCSQHVKKEFVCKVCNKAYSSLGALKMHIRTHTLPCKCHVCGKAFSRPWLLQGHVRTHTGEKPFRCSHCGRAFADRSNLRAHLQTHAEIKKYACTKCGKTFSRMSLLTKHSEGSCPGNIRSGDLPGQ